MFIPRSLLYCSALHPERYSKGSQADVMVIDLEDGVPLTKKQQARGNVAQFYRTDVGQGTALRINCLRDQHGLRDLLLIQSLEHRPEYIIMAMTTAAAEVDLVRANLSQASPGPKILVTVETPRCLRDLYDIAATADGLIFGSADYAASLGVPIGGWAPLLHARCSIIAAATAANIPAFDTAFFNLDDPAGLQQECRGAHELGFSGKTAIHPGQIAMINETFTPSADEYHQALAIVQAAENSDDSITRLKHLMIGPPFVKQARKVILRVQSLGG